MNVKRPAGMYIAGDETLFRLFDVTEMEHVCDLVRQLKDPARKCARAAFSEALRRLLLVPIDRFIDRLHENGRGLGAIEYPAANQFRTTIENVARLLALREGGPMESHVACELANDLESSWTKFIAHGAAFRMNHDLPRDLADRASRQKRNAKNSKVGGNTTKMKYARPDLDNLIRAAVEKSGPMHVEAWVEEFRLSRSSVYRRIERIKKE